MHLLCPRVGAELLVHGCVSNKPIPIFKKTIVEVKPYDMPVTKLLSFDYQYDKEKL